MWTHLEGFDQLSIEELDALIEAPVLITALVGAADGEFDREERTWTDRLMQSRTYNKPKHLNAYYGVVAHDFITKVDAALLGFPVDVQQRNHHISLKLANINPILARLDPLLGADLYKSYIALAKETAKASGGFLRIGAISSAEAPWINLPMLTPIAPPLGTKPVEDDWDEDKLDEERED
jgi:hypothetical protein